MTDTTFEIRDVNGIADLTVTLSGPGVYVARGRNGVGKTSTVNAIRRGACVRRWPPFLGAGFLLDLLQGGDRTSVHLLVRQDAKHVDHIVASHIATGSSNEPKSGDGLPNCREMAIASHGIQQQGGDHRISTSGRTAPYRQSCSLAFGWATILKKPQVNFANPGMVRRNLKGGVRERSLTLDALIRHVGTPVSKRADDRVRCECSSLSPLGKNPRGLCAGLPAGFWKDLDHPGEGCASVDLEVLPPPLASGGLELFEVTPHFPFKLPLLLLFPRGRILT